eukprot:CAMPEP_0180243560 /NCGR_PEP_ID=MMETSP0987-20121128/33907_1 /TAXON_ID=697907 /ORGANISM="non described non described, Strain CCMP2293" /LENGTH=36 /DNA_ID= /DNA_START= /DNA_END= /DNA_ORIENTATION=
MSGSRSASSSSANASSVVRVLRQTALVLSSPPRGLA